MDPDGRHLRVFVSSTFLDMQAERDYLVKFTFPLLRRLCEVRNVTWGEVDLRWGVTEEAAAEGKVLPICLEEIRRCRPFFIGLLGDRYGWVPESVPLEVLEREPWLQQHLAAGKSVTELEILYGVLLPGLPVQQACFYFRALAAPQAATGANAEKLSHLKEEIRQARDRHQCSLRESYHDAEELGKWVLEDFTALINRHWPEGSQPEPLDREWRDHETFARSRVKVYIARPEHLRQLNAFAEGESAGKPLVVLGESGSGKSALLANWVASYRAAHPEELVLTHYLGATPESSDWASMLRRILGEFKRRFSLREEIPVQWEDLRASFSYWLRLASASGKTVLVLDALDQMQDAQAARYLTWLPEHLPENVRMIVSTLPGRAREELHRRSCPVLEVHPLTPKERLQLIEDYLALYTKALSEVRARRIAAAPPCANSLYLRVLLEELRLFGVHDRLDERIGHYLQAADPPALFERVLARWEADYSAGTSLIGDALSLLWASRHGLTENELLLALGADGAPLPQARWSPLSLAAGEALVNQDGQLGFFHQHLRQAVENRYLSTEEHQMAAHRRLATFFEAQPPGYRRSGEWFWQLRAAEDREGLELALLDIDSIEFLLDEDGYEAWSYWVWLGKVDSAAHAYEEAFHGWVTTQSDLKHAAEVAGSLSSLLEHRLENAKAAEAMDRWALDALATVHGPDSPELASSLGNLANYAMERREWKEAVTLLDRALRLDALWPDGKRSQTGAFLGTLAIIHRRLGSLEEAEKYCRASIAIFEWKYGRNHFSGAQGHQNLANILMTAGRNEEAEPISRHALQVDEQNLGPNHPYIALQLDLLTDILRNLRRFKEAEAVARRAMLIRERFFGPEDLVMIRSLRYLAAILTMRHRYWQASRAFSRAIQILRRQEAILGSPHPDLKTLRHHFWISIRLALFEWVAIPALIAAACWALAHRN